ncbi:alpha-D-ribose 1-methylphosphonate 5-triphosphate diphosphatase [Labrys monachus]|uniref:Alpha-D-ribose 1-methylphosphonate 5-triphosphate diphosphatase n=1 Tax=Labrys monachus TaxID=217067 RepID=A0ABU0FKW1_9HYPH|nr:alpha-D-ribose 1-methylphosphonate 5-triphosphate diphosphatase [Labrys monachus]MDQ0394680.1 alpha-D-ribose 1-methylphosphonate 5-triphosphate diphosphatase [Labrys monachus]
MPDRDQFLLTNARLVLVDRIVEHGWLAVDKGMIVDLGEGEAPEPGLDMGGDHVVPGLIELHTDHLEAHYAPRPTVRWHALSAVMAYDAQIAASGITTVFDSIRLGSENEENTISSEGNILAAALEEARRGGHLRVEHRTHLRCELATHDVLADFERYHGSYEIHMLSLMDHTPGQRQFRNLDQWMKFYMPKRGLDGADVQAYIDAKLDKHARYASHSRTSLVALARRHGIVLASHDDATATHVEEAVADGVAIAEFPTTLEAALASHAAGIRVMMGAPNVVRGSSHSGNIAAADLAREKVLDILSSDYVPGSLLLAAFLLPERVPAIDLPAAIRMVTDTPARATGLDDRGRLEKGRRADLLRVGSAGSTPIVRRVWREGRIAA